MSGLPNVNINLLDGGLARPAPGQDHISGIVVYQGAAIDAIAARQFRNAAEAEAHTPALTAEGLFHVQEFFRMAPGATLWYSQIGDTSATPAEAVAQLVAMQAAAGGTIRQFVLCGTGVGTDAATYETTAAAVGTQMETFLEEKRPAVCLIPNGFTVGANRAPVAPALSANKRFVGYVAAKDGNNATNPTGFFAAGTALGCLARGRVGQDIGGVTSFPLSDGSRFNVVLLGSTNINFKSFSASELDALSNARIILVRELPGQSGAWFSQGATLAPATSDYAFLNNCRRAQKAVRLAYVAYVREVNEDNAIVDETTGLLTQETVDYYEAIGRQALQVMIQERDLTSVQVVVDATTNVLSTDTIPVALRLLPPGTTRFFDITIGFFNPLSN
jgi:predicted hotdog family 3-hydroxylacyl-ACP dehydratase